MINNNNGNNNNGNNNNWNNNEHITIPIYEPMTFSLFPMRIV